jgi:hypothetical protein
MSTADFRPRSRKFKKFCRKLVFRRARRFPAAGPKIQKFCPKLFTATRRKSLQKWPKNTERHLFPKGERGHFLKKFRGEFSAAGPKISHNVGWNKKVAFHCIPHNPCLKKRKNHCVIVENFPWEKEFCVPHDELFFIYFMKNCTNKCSEKKWWFLALKKELQFFL